MKYFHDLLSRRDAAQHLFTERLLLDPRHESFGHVEVDVCFE
jgi:hypothetical protein